MATKRKTVAAGAVIARGLVQRKIARMTKQAMGISSSQEYRLGYRVGLLELAQWLKQQPKRTARPGGIGR